MIAQLSSTFGSLGCLLPPKPALSTPAAMPIHECCFRKRRVSWGNCLWEPQAQERRAESQGGTAKYSPDKEVTEVSLDAKTSMQRFLGVAQALLPLERPTLTGWMTSPGGTNGPEKPHLGLPPTPAHGLGSPFKLSLEPSVLL